MARILGIESSCDETAAAIVEDGGAILSNVVLSQVPVHRIYGGVVPELASREHLRAVVPIVRQALEQAGMSLAGIDAIAVTHGPGLVGALLVGLTYAKALAMAADKPLIGVNHIEGHLHAVLLEERRHGRPDPPLPAIALVVSGGHTQLYWVERAGAFGYSYRRLGQTRDDAAGEAYDKVAKLLGLGYPGGPVIDRLAASGDAEAARLGRIRLKGNQLDFSFSGIKTAVLRQAQAAGLETGAAARRAAAAAHPSGALSCEECREQCDPATLNLIAAFQHAVVGDLVERTLAAADAMLEVAGPVSLGVAPAATPAPRAGGPGDGRSLPRSARGVSEMPPPEGYPHEGEAAQSIWVTGGVAANRALRQRLTAAAARQGLSVFAPAPGLCTDNAAMIAAAAWPKFQAHAWADTSLRAYAQLAV